MSEASTVHSAPQAAAGYLYQARVALLEALRYAYHDSGIEIAIEKFDDVSFESHGSAIELLQTKHHLKRAGDLTDRSVDLWKTLRVWADATKADPSLPSRTRFTLLTTAHAPASAAASHLRPADIGNRDPLTAQNMLMAAADASNNTALAAALASFRALTPDMRNAFFASIDIIDGAPLLADLQSPIEDRLRMIAPRGKVPLAREQLEGWWWPRICTTLQTPTPSTICVLELEHKLDDIRDGLRRDALPFDMEHVQPSPEELQTLDEMCFVRQLQSIGLGAQRLQYAKRDFYRASTQRSHWARQKLLFDGEVGRFDTTLIEEWQPRFAQMPDDLGQDSDEVTLRAAAHNLYAWVETDARFPLRATVSRFLNVGSYHILADALRVGWRPDYQTVCKDHDGGCHGR